MNIDFSNANVFVAGGTSGINLGIALAFAEAGANVGVMSRKQANIDTALTRLRACGRGWFAGYAADVRYPEQVEKALTDFARARGPITVLVSGAAGNFPALARDLSPNGFKTVVDIDLMGTFNVMNRAYPLLKKPGACLINISAPQACQAVAYQIHANAAKAGVDQVTRTLAKEWGSDGIRVNSITPGLIAGTEGVDRLLPKNGASEDSCADIARQVPLGRAGQIRDVANAALFLASDAGSYISGAVLPVDGAWGLTEIRLGPSS
ncbi:SDR family oxidoreductase [Solimonas terrae]|uniref:SDR family oxidoreductase n=1 Tax=Solimonas terrae TaxID=1396819 RepID=A0A6M2BPF4_9GAMM|nr:SDR family oxidoreductase [Solimonas terrae]NGY04358.1 SDR family oxidoreductase [Solimonas terrae]